MKESDMPTVEFVYEESCPNIQATRTRLIEAFQIAGLRPSWSEWEVNDPVAPAHVKGFGSPTILVDGKDIAGASAGEAEHCCRIYALDNENSGVPPLDMIVAALKSQAATTAEPKPRRLKSIRMNATLLPTIGIALLPKLTCPACWPAYAGLLSSLGLGFIDYTPYLLPLTGGFLAISVLALAYRASTRRGYGPFFLGVVSTLVILVGKFGYASDPAMWAGLSTLVVASAWNSWPRKNIDSTGSATTCNACIGTEAKPI